MAVVITLADVRAEYPSNQSSDTMLNAFIATVDNADACLDANSVPDAIQTALKLLGVGVIVESTFGTISSEQSANGSRVDYKDGSDGLMSQLKAIDTFGCIQAVIKSTAPDVYFGAGGC
tara:strand:- start:2422 stop:2778 length:357 start_codon:yes stop_codon:yes gene_type:complete